MNSDLLSSPLHARSSLPPSSAPLPSLTPTRRSTPRRAPDVLAFDNDEAQEAGEDDGHPGRRRRRQRMQQINRDVPIVKDAVGESVAEAFETFLKTSVHSLPLCSTVQFDSKFR